jgi:hypothetical protein
MFIYDLLENVLKGNSVRPISYNVWPLLRNTTANHKMAGWDSLLSETSIVAWQFIADDRAGKPVKITGARLCCICLAYVFQGSIMLSALYKLTLSAQAKVTLQLTVSLSDLVERFLASALAGGGGGPKNFVHRPRTRFRRLCGSHAKFFVPISQSSGM